MYRLPSTVRSLAIRKAQQVHQVQRWYAKDVRFGSEVRALMLKGVDILADAVAVTMGPKVHTSFPCGIHSLFLLNLISGP